MIYHSQHCIEFINDLQLIIILTIIYTQYRHFGDPDETHSVYIMTEPQELVYKR